MKNFLAFLLLELSTVYHALGLSHEGSGAIYPNSSNEVVHEETYYTPEVDYKSVCYLCKMALGLIVRCRVLPYIQHGTYSCSRGFLVHSRCDYSCIQGYQIEGDRYRVCQEGGSWSGAEPTCADHDPPKLKCPLSRVKVAEPGKLTATVSWERPTATDTADTSLQILRNGPESGSEFSEGQYVIRYKVYDQARNMATCKFTVHVEVKRCPVLKAPLHGYLSCSSDNNNYGAVCEYHCDPGFERSGISTRVCLLNRSWSDQATECTRK
ncbi:hypothetical protein QTP86_002727 [Hemibagrus guttatus]|nr:hypothetical protein QTP86_002727 [Hemibagrus guttatus]